MKVLIVKLSAFGDIIHALPALDDVLQHPKVSEVHWLVDSRYAFVTDIFPPTVKVHQVALKGSNRLRHAMRVIRALRREHFDCIIDLQGLIKSGMIARAIGHPVYGFDARESPEWPNRYLTTPVSFHPEEKHVVQKYRRIARHALGWIDHDAIAYLSPTIHDDVCTRLQQQASNTCPEGEYVVLHVGGGWETKKMPPAIWQELARHIAEQDVQVVFSWGSDAERMEAESLAETGMQVLPERLNTASLSRLLSKAQAVFGMDTGVLHLAAALGTPTITMWGPSASWNSAPLGEHHAHVESNPPCGPCFKRTCDHFICLPSLQTKQILQAWQEIRS